MEVASFSEIAEEFQARVARIVWCTVSTVDTKGRPRSRILHPIWEGSTGYIATSPNSLKAKHLAKNPHVSLSYWDQQHQQVYADCRAEWIGDAAERHRIWDLYKTTPPPLGYDPAMIPIWKDGPDTPDFGVLKLAPWRIELFGIAQMATGQQPAVWRPRG